ncbi:putative glycerol-3-phosphate transporter 5 isoform X2 [Gigantopelta aegis]|nr:putative glycerol-3-phosphate transporter 5 isoform X2 [Gigantopelta aegis]
MMAVSLRCRQIYIFILGWIAYASTYILRKPLGVIKAELEIALPVSRTELGWLDSALLFPYAFVQMFFGHVGDRFGARVTFGICLILSALSMVSFGYWDDLYMLMILLFLTGAAQAHCWPNCTKALLSWFPDKVRNSVFGMFGTCAFSGGILGTIIAVYLQTHYGWRHVYLFPSLFVAAIGVVVLFTFSQPSEVGIQVPGKEQNTVSNEKTAQQSLSILQLWKIPMIAEVAVAMFCLKVVRYTMYMWLPMYLLKHLGYTKGMAGVFSTAFEVGGVVGSGLVGFVLDRYFPNRTLVGTAISIALSTLALCVFVVTSSWGLAVNSICMFLAGAFNAGPDTLLGGSIPIELGEKDNRNSGSATVGLVNGFGSIGTCIEGPVIGLISTYYGWTGMFYVMIGLSALATVTVFKASVIYKKVDQTIIVEPI